MPAGGRGHLDGGGGGYAIKTLVAGRSRRDKEPALEFAEASRDPMPRG